ncbi:MAG TPA: DUF2252 domain-containing protein [Acidimicrobiales bacterium]
MSPSADPAKPPVITHLTPSERAARGKAARAVMPRASHGAWAPDEPRRQPLDLLAEQATTRVPELVPIRHGRMAASPFAFFRGAAYVLASDLASSPRSGLNVQLCGDAHLANFGGFASPERSFVFDLNDFDETLPGPFEWDVKRLAASVEIAARSRGFDAKVRTAIVTGTVRSYRQAMRTFATMSNLDVWYTRLDVDTVLKTWGQEVAGDALKNIQRAVQKAESKDRLKAKVKLTELVGDELRFRSDPPLLVPAEEVFSEADHEQLETSIRQALRSYRRSLSGDRRRLVESYGYRQLARKVVGVGSVGTRAWLALMIGRDNDDPLFLQVKEAEASVLEPFLAKSTFANHGQRVVEGQRLMQATSDILLGWQRVDGVDGRTHDYYMRQLWDWKASADVDNMTAQTLGVYGQLCGWALARGHARSGDRIAIGSYLGNGTTFERAMAEFATAYAEQNDLDHRSLVDAIADGRVQAQSGI